MSLEEEQPGRRTAQHKTLASTSLRRPTQSEEYTCICKIILFLFTTPSMQIAGRRIKVNNQRALDADNNNESCDYRTNERKLLLSRVLHTRKCKNKANLGCCRTSRSQSANVAVANLSVLLPAKGIDKDENIFHSNSCVAGLVRFQNNGRQNQ